MQLDVNISGAAHFSQRRAWHYQKPSPTNQKAVLDDQKQSHSRSLPNALAFSGERPTEGAKRPR